MTTDLQCPSRDEHGTHTWRQPEAQWPRYLCHGYRVLPPDDPTWPLSKRPRWCYGDRRSYDWAQCRYCHRAQAHDCEAAQCPLCGTVQCRNRPQCAVCMHGAIDGFYRPRGRVCGYKGCGKEIVAEKIPRVKQCCAYHAQHVKLRMGGATIALPDYVQARIAHRDSGQGWEKWRLIA